MAADTPDEDIRTDAPRPSDAEQERAMREAEARALAESGLGSGLLARQSAASDAESVPVLKVCPQCGTEYETAARFCPADGTALRPKGSDSLVGRVLADRYHILKRIGEGGMGRVYLGEHVKMNRQCAIKVMNPALVNDAESAARFAREASSAARIIHPNVAAVFDYGESEGLVYLVMEFVDGEPLSRLLAREAPFALDRALDIARQIADGLGAAHELGIIHRDLKPDNILVMRSRAGKEVAKVVDFGIAKAVQEQGNEALTRTGLVIGTPEFMSPEQLLGDPIDARSDLYALGCILHLMLTAVPPFEATTREQMIKRRLSEDAPAVQDADPGLPDSVARIVARLLARSPADRYGSAAEVRDALSGAHVRRSGPEAAARMSNPTPRSAPTVAFMQATQATTEVTHVPISKRSRRGPFVAIGALVLLGGAAALYARSAAERDRVDQVRRDSISAAQFALARADSIRNDSINAATAPVAMVDSAQLLARLAEKKHADSVAKAAAADTASVRAAITRYSKALESGSIAALRSAYPGLTGSQSDQWGRIFDGAETIRTRVSYNSTRIRGDSATIDFSLQLTIARKNGTPSPTTFRQSATLTRQRGGPWQIAQVTAR